MKGLRLTRLGDPVLRRVARELTAAEIKSSEIRHLITDMLKTNEVKGGLGLAAPQVGVLVALAVIDIRPTKNRPKAEPYRSVVINPRFIGVGRRVRTWEGCLSAGSGSNVLFGQTLRYKRIQAQWLDEGGRAHDEELSGLVAHVFQHETEHLQGVLFVDRVHDTKTFMVASEYRKRILKKASLGQDNTV